MSPGDKRGMLTLQQSIVESGRTYWLCQCECGGRAKVRLDHLTAGASRSCGCLRHAAKNRALSSGLSGRRK